MREPDDLTLLSDAVLAAGEIAMRHFKQDVEIWDKGSSLGPVTEADLAVDAYLQQTLTTARPQTGWLSEESGTPEARADAEEVFIVDPIDGTRAFIEHSDHWAISAAIARSGTVEAGAVYLPAKERLYLATRDGGATLNRNPIQTSQTEDLNAARILTTKPNMAAEFWQNGPPRFKRSFRSSLAYRLCLVAEGRYDAMITLRPTWEWDVAAGLLIVEEAGGLGSDGNGNRPTFNNPHPQIAGTIAGGAVHSALIAERSALPIPGSGFTKGG